MEMTNGNVDSAHYGPLGDAARNVASYCDGAARVHVYTAAFDALATQADALAKVTAERDAAREALEEIRRWSQDAYATDIFDEPDLEAVNRVLTDNGLRGHMDRMHASWGRHLMQGVGKIAESALTRAALTETTHDRA